MIFHRAIAVFALLALTTVSATVVAEETIREAVVEATLPQPGTVMVAGFDSLWMMDTMTNNLARIHPGNNSVTEIPISGAVGPFWASGMAVGEGAVWVPDLERSMIYKIDPSTNQVVKEIPADLVGGRGPGGQYAIAVGEGAVWAIASNNELRRYSAENGTQEAAISLPSRSSGVVVAYGSVWITGTANDDPKSGSWYRIAPRICSAAQPLRAPHAGARRSGGSS